MRGLRQQCQAGNNVVYTYENMIARLSPGETEYGSMNNKGRIL